MGPRASHYRTWRRNCSTITWSTIFNAVIIEIPIHYWWRAIVKFPWIFVSVTIDVRNFAKIQYAICTLVYIAKQVGLCGISFVHTRRYLKYKIRIWVTIKRTCLLLQMLVKPRAPTITYTLILKVIPLILKVIPWYIISENKIFSSFPSVHYVF